MLNLIPASNDWISSKLEECMSGVSLELVPQTPISIRVWGTKLVWRTCIIIILLCVLYYVMYDVKKTIIKSYYVQYVVLISFAKINSSEPCIIIVCMWWLMYTLTVVSVMISIPRGLLHFCGCMTNLQNDHKTVPPNTCNITSLRGWQLHKRIATSWKCKIFSRLSSSRLSQEYSPTCLLRC